MMNNHRKAGKNIKINILNYPENYTERTFLCDNDIKTGSHYVAINPNLMQRDTNRRVINNGRRSIISKNYVSSNENRTPNSIIYPCIPYLMDNSISMVINSQRDYSKNRTKANKFINPKYPSFIDKNIPNLSHLSKISMTEINLDPEISHIRNGSVISVRCRTSKNLNNVTKVKENSYKYSYLDSKLRTKKIAIKSKFREIQYKINNTSNPYEFNKEINKEANMLPLKTNRASMDRPALTNRIVNYEKKIICKGKGKNKSKNMVNIPYKYSHNRCNTTNLRLDDASLSKRNNCTTLYSENNKENYRGENESFFVVGNVRKYSGKESQTEINRQIPLKEYKNIIFKKINSFGQNKILIENKETKSKKCVVRHINKSNLNNNNSVVNNTKLPTNNNTLCNINNFTNNNITTNKTNIYNNNNIKSNNRNNISSVININNNNNKNNTNADNNNNKSTIFNIKSKLNLAKVLENLKIPKEKSHILSLNNYENSGYKSVRNKNSIKLNENKIDFNKRNKNNVKYNLSNKFRGLNINGIYTTEIDLGNHGYKNIKVSEENMDNYEEGVGDVNNINNINNINNVNNVNNINNLIINNVTNVVNNISNKQLLLQNKHTNRAPIYNKIVKLSAYTKIIHNKSKTEFLGSDFKVKNNLNNTEFTEFTYQQPYILRNKISKIMPNKISDNLAVKSMQNNYGNNIRIEENLCDNSNMLTEYNINDTKIDDLILPGNNNKIEKNGKNNTFFYNKIHVPKRVKSNSIGKRNVVYHTHKSFKLRLKIKAGESNVSNSLFDKDNLNPLPKNNDDNFDDLNAVVHKINFKEEISNMNLVLPYSIKPTSYFEKFDKVFADFLREMKQNNNNNITNNNNTSNNNESTGGKTCGSSSIKKKINNKF